MKATSIKLSVFLPWVAALVFLNMSGSALGDKAWTGAIDTDWFNLNNWSPAGVPGDGDNVLVTNVANGILLTNSTAMLGSFTITNATLTCSNWTTALKATNVTIQNGGRFTLPAAFINAAMSNRVHIVCTNFTIAAGGTINVNGKGYAADNGPGKGSPSSYGGGGGYGGKGGADMSGVGTGQGVTYGAANTPTAPGSGGSGGGTNSGGGAVLVEAGGTAIVDGTISANGGSQLAVGLGGGSGGSVYLRCGVFGGSAAGLLSAIGGENIIGYSGGGGGGRIAVEYASLAATHAVRISAANGIGAADYQSASWQRSAEMGTLYLSDTNLLSETLNGFTGRLVIPGFTSWTVNNLTVTNGSVTFDQSGFQLTVSNRLLVDKNGRLGIHSGTISIGENLVLTNGGSMDVFSGDTNGSSPSYGALVSVTNDVLIGASSWIYAYSSATNGGSALFRMRNVMIASNGGFSASARGYRVGQGPGHGGGNFTTSSGGGYGGKGGMSSGSITGGPSYGLAIAPIYPGSGGGADNGNTNYALNGGGLIRLDASGRVTLNGTIAADGGKSLSNNGGTGSGGGIFIRCVTFEGGASGLLSAKGGDYITSPGGGGGGRIAVWYGAVSDAILARILAGGQLGRGAIVSSNYYGFAGTISVTNGLGYYNGPPNGAEPGSVSFLTYTTGTILMTY